MRTLEHLAQLYPNKTGKELLEIQEQEKLEDVKREESLHKGNLDIVENINTNGVYIKCTSTPSKYHFYKIYKAYYNKEYKIITVDYETITLFTQFKNSHFSFTKEKIKNFLYSKLGIIISGKSINEKVSKEEWDKINDFLETIPSMCFDLSLKKKAMSITEEANLRHAQNSLNMLKNAVRKKDRTGIKNAEEYADKYVNWDSYNTEGLAELYDEWEGELEDAENI